MFLKWNSIFYSAPFYKLCRCVIIKKNYLSTTSETAVSDDGKMMSESTNKDTGKTSNYRNSVRSYKSTDCLEAARKRFWAEPGDSPSQICTTWHH